MLTLSSDNLALQGEVAVDLDLLRVGRGVLYTAQEGIL